MLLNKLIPLNRVLPNARLFHGTETNAAIGNVMKKIMGGSKRKKRLYQEEAVVPTSSAFTKDLFRKRNPENKRRLAVLNKLFMMHITDLMTTGDYSLEFAGYGLEISKVKVTPDYHGINVYWLARDGINVEELTKLLDSKSHPLRHELTQMHLVGIVPRIKFVKDKEYGKIAEVESRLAYADFGEDHEPSEISYRYKTYSELTKSLDPELKERILSLEELTTSNEIEEIPPMPHNVLGLNHSEIMERVINGMKKSQASHRSRTSAEISADQPFNPDPIEFTNAKSQREAFQKFLTERQILRNKARKGVKNYRLDWDYLEEESEIVKQQRLESIKIADIDDTDYVEEEIEDGNNRDEKL